MNPRSKKTLPAQNGTAHESPPQPAPRRGVAASLLACTLLLAIVAATPPKESAKRFPNPEAAVEALTTAANARDIPALTAIFGPAFTEICSPDPTQRENELQDFTKALNQSHRIVNNGRNGDMELELGNDQWPFPIPIVKRDGQWFFDTDAGKQEIINRRIGRNELSALRTVRGYVEAQREYAMRDRDGDSVLEYGQKLASSPGQKDGLYWPPDLDGEISPLGPLVAAAQSAGYGKSAPGSAATTEPFQGYYFKIITTQGKDTPGGQYDYIINGNMIGGFALVAYPSDYGESGIMTLIVNQQGRVYEKDLGPDTAKVAGSMSVYNPDKTWKPSRD